MADSTPPSRSRVDLHDDDSIESASSRDSVSSRESQPRRPLRLIDQGIRASQPSHPPSEPRPIPGRPGADASPDRPARIQLIAALLLLLVLVVVPLYLWRRPRAAATEESAKNAAALALASAQVADTASPPPDPTVHAKDGVTVADAKVTACHDPGSKRTAPGACDRLPTFESAIAKAVLDSAACVPPGTPPGTIAFRVDVSYARHKNPIRVLLARDRTTMSGKIATACATDVKKALSTSSLDQTHAHARYDLTIDATYKR